MKSKQKSFFLEIKKCKFAQKKNRMGKYLFLFITLGTLFFSCSPEGILNKKLEGTWVLQSINGVELGDSITQTLTFKEGKRYDGEVSELATKNSQTITNNGVYYIFKSQTLTMAFSDDPNVDTRVFSVIESSKTDLTLTQEGDGNAKFVYKKK